MPARLLGAVPVVRRAVPEDALLSDAPDAERLPEAPDAREPLDCPERPFAEPCKESTPCLIPSAALLTPSFNFLEKSSNEF